MKQALHHKTTRRPISKGMEHRLREGLFIISIAFAIFLLISFATFEHTDPGWSSTGIGDKVLNRGGRIGAFLADVFLSVFGYLAFLLPPMVVFAAWVGMQYEKENEVSWNDVILKAIGFVFIVLSGCGILALYLHFSLPVAANAGGMLGDITVKELSRVLNNSGTALLLVSLFLSGATLFVGISWIGLLKASGNYVATKIKQRATVKKIDPPKIQEEPRLEILKKKLAMTAHEPRKLEPKIVRSVRIEKTAAAAKKMVSSITVKPGDVPPVTLLDPPMPAEGKAFSHISFESLSVLVEQRLQDFGVDAKVVAVHPGPVITRFELDLAPGVKVSKISGIAKDIARSLSVSSVRVVEVIPGKSYVGLELPNEHREVVSLREILESERYSQSRSPMSLALGKDIAGYPVVVDLAKMPHLLVAGTTGSGKSVSLNAMLLSMLFKATPEQLRMIMIDPKMLELSVYEGIPHLLTPVITDMKDAANALRWCVAEMDRRYRLMSSLGVRNLQGFNTKVAEMDKQGNPIPTPDWLLALGQMGPTLQSLPMIVVVVDELADMMMVVGKKVEELVTRIAQKARAAGIHLILATQRPSVDVITGLIKANVPTRIAFQVSSRIDSRTILDQQGAEQLLGNGDMLYLPPGTGMPVRVHGAYVGDDEVHRVVAAWQTYGKPTYQQEILEGGGETAFGSEDPANSESDPLYDEALRIVTESRRASISLVQRRLRIGYNRAARMMEEMEAAGVVSSMDTSGSREVLAPPPVEV